MLCEVYDVADGRCEVRFSAVAVRARGVGRGHVCGNVELRVATLCGGER